MSNDSASDVGALHERPVVHVDSERGFSGGEVQVFLLMEGLRDAGVAQQLVVPPGSASARIAKERGFDVVELALRNNVDLGSVRALAKVLRGASLVHLHTGRATWLGSLAAWRAGCPSVITRRMDRRVKRGPRNRLAYRRVARAVIAISPSVRDSLVAGGVPAERIEMIPDALDPTRIEVSLGRGAVRTELGIEPERIVLLALAQLVHRKGLDVLLRAVAELQDPRALCVLAGDGPEAGSLRELATQLGVSDRVQFLGTRSDAGDLLAACDVFCLPSRAEGMGVAALEALGASRPVVASRVGGLGQLVVDGVSGLLVPPDDVAALAAALRKLIDDAPLRQRLAEAGPRRVDEGYRPEQYVARHLEVYADVLRG
ncbi:MAG: glycosyltransferase family 4 protein [Planctomycetota bacterium]